MKTTIDNTQRVFLIHRIGFSSRDYFSNLAQIPEILKEELEPNDQFVIKEYYNQKLNRCSKKHLNAMFKANKIDFRIK